MTQELPMPPRTQAIQMVQDKVQRVGHLRSQTYWFSCILIVGFCMEQERIYRYFMIFCLSGMFHGTEDFWNDQTQFGGFENDAVDAPWPYATSIGTMVVNQWMRYPMFQIRAIKEHWQPIYTIQGGRYSYHHFCVQFFVGVSICMDVFWCM